MFDLIIIGGGPGGYKAAEHASKAGLNVCLFENRSLGGVCLNEGCIPSKALLYSAKLYDYAKGGSAKYGVTSGNVIMDYKTAVERKDKVVKTLISGVEATMKKLKVTVIRENAVIEGKSSEGFKVNGKLGRNLIIASGSEPIIPNIKGADTCMTSRELLALTEVPESLAVIGGGVIGLEMASLFNSVGSKVTVYEALGRIGGTLDIKLAEMLQKVYTKKGITFKLNYKVSDISELGTDKVLICVGRRANTKNLGLEALNIYTEKGVIVSDNQLRTNLPGIYAIGDVNGKMMLAHTAYREAEVAVNTILGKYDEMRYESVPSVIYTNPEAAWVGETAESAVAKGYKVTVRELPMSYNGRFVAENEDLTGICSLVIDTVTDRLLGVHMLGNSSSEAIMSAVFAIERKMTAGQLSPIIPPHPTIGEIIKEASY